MQIMKDVYQLSGVPLATNSNSYVIRAGGQLILIDAGFSDLQWEKMEQMLRFWGLDGLPVTHTLFTHCHFDHAGNAWRARELGSRILAGPGDAKAMEEGDRNCIGYLFGREFRPCKVDEVLEDGQVLSFGDVRIRVLHVPGHSRGSMMYEASLHDKKILFLGDFLAVEPAAPEDDIKVMLAWTGAPDFSRQDYLKSLEKASGLHEDILCPGHYHLLYGPDVCKRALLMAYELGKETLPL